MLEKFRFLTSSVKYFRGKNYSKEVPKILGSHTKPDPKNIEHDYIGPPDKESNLRPIVRCIPENETDLQRRLREKRMLVEQWNQDFWSRHNQRYYEEKDIFVKKQKLLSGEENISPDKMSEFYKKFLDKNWKLHFYYNISWYMKNFDMLILAGQVNAQSLWRKLKPPN